MEDLKKKRTPLKAKITRIENWLSQKASTEKDALQFQFRQTELKTCFLKYEEIMDQIDEIDEAGTEAEDRVTTEQKYFSILAGLQRKMDELLLGPPPLRSNSTQSTVATAKVRLPEITMQTFCGSFSEFNSFYQLFETLIVNNEELNNVQRFIYLKSFLRNEPLQLIDNIEVIDENFDIAVKTLKDRYENKSRVISLHIQKLLKAPSLVKSNSKALREFLTLAQQTLLALKNMSVPIEHWDLLLIEIFLQKLDFATHRAFEYDIGTKTLPTLSQFFKFLEKKCDIQEKLNVSDHDKKVNNRSQSKTSFFSSVDQPSHSFSDNNCTFCRSNAHKVYQCNDFKCLSLQEKFNFVKGKKLCFNCLGSKHFSQDCGSTRSCTLCGGHHHSSLHGTSENVSSSRNINRQALSRERNAQTPQNSQGASRVVAPISTQHSFNNRSQNEASTSSSRPPLDMQNSPDSQAATSLSALSVKTDVLLATALVTVYSKDGRPMHARALLDNGSQHSFISRDLVEKLKLIPYFKQLQISTISENTSLSNEMLNLEFFPYNVKDRSFKTSFAVLDSITCRLPRATIDRSKIKVPQDLTLADPSYSVPGKIDLLLAGDIYSELLTDGFIRLGKNLPILQNTHLGYVIFGTINPQVFHRNSHLAISQSNVSLFVQSEPEENQLDKLLQQFFEIEEVPLVSKLTPDEELAEQIFSKTTLVLPSGRFQVNLPFVSENANKMLGESFKMAFKRFMNLEHRLLKNESTYAQYKSFINEYLLLEHAKIVPLSLTNEKLENKYFLPHHCVFKEESLTTKLRVVFDGSMKSSSGYSLNDILLKGPTLQPELFDILLRFRLYSFVFTTDIQKMYRQVRINPAQTSLLNILWRDSPEKDIACLELQTVTYGTKSASFQSTRCLMELAQTHQIEYPLASDALQNSCYIDDILYGANDVQTLLKAHKEITSLLGTACISLHKWCSNSDLFLKNISSLSSNTTYVIAPDNGSNKVLGLCWNPILDTFSISLPNFTLKDSYTKREVLSMIAQIFDPQGLINPVTVVAKLIMQQIWISKINWNDIIDADTLHEWLNFVRSLSNFKDLNIPRCLFLSQEITSVEIHAFSDASLKAYGACIYLRVIYRSEQVSCSLLASKSRVAPLKPLTLPRLELMGALLCSKLTARIANIIEEKLSRLDSINMWSDSEIVLAWLRSHPSRWTQFVANRVAQILDNSPNAHWRHVRSKENPADILSRGMLPAEILKSSLWFHGPQFLNQSRLDLLKYNPKVYTSKLPEERKVTLHIRNDQIDFFTSLSDRFSNFSRFVRTLAFIFRFANNAKSPSHKLSNSLEVSELQNAELKIVKMLQYSSFSLEISEIKKGKTLSNKSILRLNPFLDENEMLRVGGRLGNSDVTFDQKYPLLLPSKNRVVRLILQREHIRLCHSGPQNTLSQIRLKYWPLNGLREVKKVIHQCMVCFRFNAKPAIQIMADLPKERLQSSRVFAHVGLDFGGPFQIKASKLRKAPLIKSYIALFVCLSTRAVHIEVVSGLSTETFLLALKRFISRRGLPQTIFSDNATNFLGARNQLFELYKFLKEKENSRSINDFLASSHIRWKTIVPRAPHHGGIWESAIKSAKHHIRRLMGDIKLTFEEFTTVLTQIEAVLNSRPLCSLSNDPSDLTYLTPGHFLIGQSLTSFPERDVIHIPENRLSLWQHLSKLQQMFWKKWSIDYLNRLQNRPKWFLPHKNLEPNDLVLLIEDNTPPLYWALARVIDVFPGKDGRVRVASVKTKDGVFKRSINKLCPLPNDC